MALHRGSDGFMSLDQFKTFYWPTYKKVVMGLIDIGLTPVPFYEGIWDQRLEFLREFPKGKTIAHFAQTDMNKAKEVLGGHTCIMGDVPSSILQVGTVSEVEDYCRKLIDDCGKDGGLIVTHMPIDEADPKLVKAMIDVTRRIRQVRLASLGTPAAGAPAAGVPYQKSVGKVKIRYLS